MKRKVFSIIAAIVLLAFAMGIYAVATPGVRPTGAITWSTDNVRIRGSETTGTVAYSQDMTSTAAYYTKYYFTGADSQSATTVTAETTRTAAVTYTPSTTCTTDGIVYIWFTNGVDTETETIVTTPTAGGSFEIDVETPTATMRYSYSSESGTDTVLITAEYNEAMDMETTTSISITGDNTETANMKWADTTHSFYAHEITTTAEGTCTVAISGCKDTAGNTITASAPTNSTFPINDSDTESNTANDALLVIFGALGGGAVAKGAPKVWQTVARKRN